MDLNDLNDPKRHEIAVLLDTGMAFALKDAVTVMWLLSEGRVREALELVENEYGQAQVAVACEAAEVLEKAIRPIARQTYRDMRRLLGDEEGE